ncbi:PAS domain S-box protein [Methanoplanus endosymbiosus]|uniref:histidine kinase n=1 Tax=Methanoplanus endosymbiosus TaxID=33865 RepID=A0A9E7PN38_9EURY|nr:PAS domain S-box protein [Methanoplanus endosymbiosus]UUX92905.1 PAS domain S-box protein [Methanoplanus endosymbiosus]
MPELSLQKYERNELAALCLKNAQELIFITDESGAVFEGNNCFLKTLGYCAGDLPSLHVWDIDANIAEKAWAGIWQQILGRNGFTFTTYRIAKDGREIPVKVSKQITEYKGHKYLFSCSQTIKKTEMDATLLPLSEERYQIFIRNYQGIAYESTIDWVPLFFKGQVKEITGYTEEEFLAGTPRWDEIIFPDDLKEIMANDNDLRTIPGTKRDRKYRIVRKDGALRWVHDTIQCTTDTAGSSVILVGSIIDITGRREAEAALLDSRKIYRNLVENINEVIFTLDLNGKFTYLSPVVESLKGGFGYTADELTGRSFTEILHPDDLAEVVQKYRRTLAGFPKTTEFRVISKSGEVRWIRESGRQILDNGEVVGLQGLFSDITEQKEAEVAKVHSELRYRRLFEAAQDGILILNYETGEILDANPFILDILGYSLNELSGLHLWDIGIFKDVADSKDAFLELKKRKYLRYDDLPLTTKDGRQIDVELVSNAYMVGSERVIQSNIRDITDRIQAEKALHKKEEEYRAITDISDDAIFLLDSEMRYEFVNPAAAAYIHMSAPSLRGMSLQDTFPKEAADYYTSVVHTVMQTGMSYTEDMLVPLPGNARWFRIRAAPFFSNGNQDRILLYATDIHELTILREALDLTNKKLNMLTSILRHDILNYLMVIKASADMIEMDLKPDEGMEKSLTFIKRSTDAIERLLKFSREYQSLGVEQPKWHSVSQVVEMVLRDGIFAGITVDMQLNNLRVFADALLYRVIFNLFENAVRHGESVTTITVRFSSDGAVGVLTVCDNGVGIPDDEKENIFRRDFGKHTGFGLYFAQEILSITGITISETGDAGEGAHFEIRIPEGSWHQDKAYQASEI